MDPLSNVLSLLKPQSLVSRGFGLTGDLAIQWPKHKGIKCYALLRGRCWLQVEGVPDPIPVTEGDCFLLPRGRPFCLTTDLSLKPMDFTVLRESGALESLCTESLDGKVYMAGGHFVLAGEHAEILLNALPPVVHIRTEEDKAAMRWSLERMEEELRANRPGVELITQQLAYVMLVQALRLHLADGASAGVGWLFALADKQMSAALSCMHEEPGAPWTLQSLAERVGMSRSVFAERFKQSVGASPLEYLTKWRMLVGGDRLRSTDASIAEIACSLGYRSESAFGKAFKKEMGCSPRQYGRMTVKSPLAMAAD
ncbi:MAG: AraC family transcriptional regulator [Acidobacteriaceae bacterium]|nr:AraC family transcriptional regulator [Acidobacteriaceae bacterium]